MQSFDRHNRQTWPPEIRTNIFIGRAVDQLGAIYFEELWTGQEVSAKKYELIPIFRRDASIDMQIHAIRARRRQGIIGIFSEEEEIERYTSYISDTDVAENLRRDEYWAALYQSLSEKNDQLRSCIDRFNHIFTIFKNLIVAKMLKTLALPVEGGRLKAIPVSFWQTTNTSFRSDRFQLSLVDPFEIHGEPADPHYIYVEKSGIEKVRAERIKLRKAKLRRQKIPDSDLENFLLTLGTRGEIGPPQRLLWERVQKQFSGCVLRKDFRTKVQELFVQEPGRRKKKTQKASSA